VKAQKADPGELLSGEEVLDRLLAEPRLRRRAVNCVLPAVKAGPEWRFRRRDLEEWIQVQLEIPVEPSRAH